MPRISSPRPLDLTKPFVTSSQSYGARPFDLSEGLVTWYRDIQGDFVPDLSGRGNNARCAGSGSHDRVTGSNDVPEYNPTNYPLRSFDLSDNATSTANVQHIRSVNNLGQAAPLDDHTFTDGTKDVPFSISFWIKVDSAVATQFIATKMANTSGVQEWNILMSSTNRIDIVLYDDGGNSGGFIQARKDSAFTGAHNGWDHFVFTYDGSGTQSGINIYRNGADVSPTRIINSPYTCMKKSVMGLCLGSSFNTTAYVPSVADLRGKIHSFAIWKNRALNSSEISALYYAYLNGPGGEVRSGFISRSPRLLLRELDDLPGSYSTVRRTGDPTRNGQLASNFDDNTTLVFSNAGNPTFPSMLPRSSAFRSQAVDIVGQDSDINVPLPIRSFQQPTYLHYSPTENVGPFDENRTIHASSFFLSGTDVETLPGFQSPMRSKVSLSIDITPGSDATFTRNLSSRNVNEGLAAGPTNTGFMYYNFSRKAWEQIGLSDPLNGNPMYYDYDLTALDIMGGVYPSGTLPAQFSVSPSYPYVSDDEKITLGYGRVGTPISAFGAPNNTMYHATASQCLRMSDLISHPFLLESVRVEFDEVRARRIQGDMPVGSYDSEASGFSDLLQSGSARDIDNYVFFMYRQSRKNRVVDSVSDISSSERYLVFSGSMTFWNSASFASSQIRDRNRVVSDSLFHTPAFSHEFGLPYSSSLNTYLTDWDPAHDTYYVRNSSVNLTSDCIAHFNFEDEVPAIGLGGGTIDDKSGNGHVATIGPSLLSSVVGADGIGTTLFGIGYPSTQILGSGFFEAGAYITSRGVLACNEFAGVDASAVITHTSDLQMTFGQGFSISMWIRPQDTTPPFEQWIVSKTDIALGTSTDYYVSIDTSGRIVWRVYGASGGYIQRRTTAGIGTFTSLTGWYHITLSYTGATGAGALFIYVDGVQRATTTSTGGTFGAAPVNHGEDVLVAGGGGINGAFFGFIGSLEFYSRHITPALAYALYILQETPLTNDPGLSIGYFSGPVDMNIKPAVCNRQSFGVSTYMRGDLQNVWLGGTSFEKFKKANWAAVDIVPYSANPFFKDSEGSPGGAAASPKSIDDSQFEALADSRATKMFGRDAEDSPLAGEQLISAINLFNDFTRHSEISPYLLLPGDEIVFGIDAGICSMQNYLSTGYSNLTGSQLVISSKPCRITFYGSLIENASAYESVLNQDLSSNSVHEIIGAEPQLDQFQIEPKSSYYGSYLDDIVTGSMATPVLGGVLFSTTNQDQSRRVVARVSLGQAGSTGSLQRFAKMSDASERTYDSCLPDPFELFGVYPSFKGPEYGLPTVYIDDATEKSSWLKTQFPFKDNPDRLSEIPKFELFDDTYGGGDTLGAYGAGLTSGLDYLFRVGWVFIKTYIYAHRKEFNTSTTTHRPVNDGRAYRYGISSTLPEYSSSRWRADHYGYLRDMLEPRQLTARYDGFNPIKVRFVTGSVNVNPMLTYSQNLSTFATSSMPYFDDGVARNRPDDPDESLVDIIA